MTSLVKIPTFTIAPYAFHAHVPVLEIAGLTIAVIFCTTPSQSAVGLILPHAPRAPTLRGRCTIRPLGSQRNEPSPKRFRICMLSNMFHQPLFTGSKSSWKDVYITHLPPPPFDACPVLLKRMVSSLSAPFRVSCGEMERLQEGGFFLDTELTTAGNWQGSSVDNSTIALVFKKCDVPAERDWYLEILLGWCGSAGAHWASIRFHDGRPEHARSCAHSCWEDQWLDGSKSFECRTEDSDFRSTVNLYPTPFPMNPVQTSQNMCRVRPRPCQEAGP